MRSERLSFKNSDGHELAARLDQPISGDPVACAVFAHCFTCSKDLKAVNNISKALTINGIAVLRFDFTGLGQSKGEFSDTNFSSNVNDLLDAAKCMEERLSAPNMLIGHSLGGAAVIMAAKHLPTVTAVVTIGAPSEPVHVKKQFGDKAEQLKKAESVEVELAGRPFTIKKQFIDDLNMVTLKDCLKNLKRALLIMHAPGDNTVSIDNAKDIYNTAMHPKSFISLDGADHLLSDRADSMYVGDVIASWCKRYIDQPTREQLQTKLDVVTSTDIDAFRTEIKAGPHSLLADEPKDMGGEDLGPDPYELLAASLGACTGMTVKMYADRKQWPLENVKVHLKHEKTYGEDVQDPDKAKTKIDEMTRQIELIGPELTDEQRARLLDIANKCPVHKTLSETKVVVKTTLL